MAGASGDAYAARMRAIEAFRRQSIADARRHVLEARAAAFVAAERAQQRAEAQRRDRAHLHQMELDARLERCPACRDWLFPNTSAGYRPEINGRKAHLHACTVPRLDRDVLLRDDLDQQAAA